MTGSGVVARAEARGLVVNRGRQRVLDSLDLVVGPGITALTGPNGSGKTTLIQTFATLLPIHRGCVLIDGTPTSSWRGSNLARRRIGYLAQEPTSLDHLTVAEACRYVAWLKRVPRTKRLSAVDEVVEQFGLADVADKRLHRLSGGTRRRAYLAQAVVSDPRVLLLDEPTAGLDPEHRAEVHQLFAALARDRAVLFSTHVAGDLAVADQVIALRRGQIVYQGTPDEVRALGSAADDASSGLENGLRRLGVG